MSDSLLVLETKIVYIYALLDPETLDLRYIGQTAEPKKRLYSHIGSSGRLTSAVSAWLQGLKSRRLRPVMKILEIAPENQKAAREGYWIDYYRPSGLLTNHGCKLVTCEYDCTVYGPLHEDAFKELLRMKIAAVGTPYKWSKQNDIPRSVVSKVLAGKLGISEALARKLGYRRVMLFEKSEETE